MPDVFTVLDETIPSPAWIQKTETIELPEIQTMTGYIRRHYEKEILAELTRKIRCGDLGVKHEGKLREIPHTGPVDNGMEDLDKALPVIPGNSRTSDHCKCNEPYASITPLTGKIVWMGFRASGCTW